MSAGVLGAGCLDRPVSPLSPSTSNVFVTQVKNSAVKKIDLLFMIDNSISMADKQAILKEAVPELVSRLVDPVCVETNKEGEVIRSEPGPGFGTDCAAPLEREFAPLADIHIGIVSSSLGGYGADLCADSQSGTPNDHAHLIGAERGLDGYAGHGFLAWDPESEQIPPGMTDVTTLVDTFQDHVVKTGETGCGFEASLESWYRFLVDPFPPASWEGGAPSQEVDQTLLDQRAAFLRPDSLVAIVMLTDENDCSINPRGQGWLTAQAAKPGSPSEHWFMPRGTSECGTNPNSPCCRPCVYTEAATPDGCTPIDQDPACSAGGYYDDRLGDSVNLRCHQQKRRFGIDFLYPTERYVNALSQPRICAGNGRDRPGRADLDPTQCDPADLVDNALLRDTRSGVERDPDLVFLAGIVGIPWQDIATEATNEVDEPGLDYLTAEEIAEAGVWDVILGSRGDASTPPTLPGDPHMIETPDVREALAGPDSPAGADAIHGHEYLIPERDDLQYACIFPLSVPTDCSNAGPSCDCSGDPSTTKNPLCQDPSSGAYGNLQHFAKAYPGVRELQVLQGFGKNSIVASICPKLLDDRNANDYGYNPAVAAIIDRLKDQLGGQCLPRQLSVEEDGTVPCAMVEALPSQDGSCAGCDALPGRSVTDSQLATAVRKQLGKTGQCGGDSGIACSDMCLCTIDQLTGDARDQCQTQDDPADAVGYCYIDATVEPVIGNPELVKTCDETERRMLRFVGDETPQNGAVTVIACIGKPISSSETLSGDPRTDRL